MRRTCLVDSRNGIEMRPIGMGSIGMAVKISALYNACISHKYSTTLIYNLLSMPLPAESL